MLGIWYLFYLLVLPKFIASEFVINSVKNIVNQQTGMSLTLDNPVLKTHFLPKIGFTLDNLELKKDDKALINVKGLDTQIDFGKIFARGIKLNKFTIQKLFVDGNNTLTLIPAI